MQEMEARFPLKLLILLVGGKNIWHDTHSEEVTSLDLSQTRPHITILKPLRIHHLVWWGDGMSQSYETPHKGKRNANHVVYFYYRLNSSSWFVAMQRRIIEFPDSTVHVECGSW